VSSARATVSITRASATGIEPAFSRRPTFSPPRKWISTPLWSYRFATNARFFVTSFAYRRNRDELTTNDLEKTRWTYVRPTGPEGLAHDVIHEEDHVVARESPQVLLSRSVVHRWDRLCHGDRGFAVLWVRGPLKFSLVVGIYIS